MALTINNTNTLALLNILNQTTASQSDTMRQLTTGKRINTGKDDPAGLVALASLNAELTAVGTSLTNNQRTDSILTVADGAVGEITSLLNEIERLVVASTSDANLTDAEIAANQAQIDDAPPSTGLSTRRTSTDSACSTARSPSEPPAPAISSWTTSASTPAARVRRPPA